MRAGHVAVALLFLAGEALAASPANDCPAGRAVYLATLTDHENNVPPDELRLRFPQAGDPGTPFGLPRLIVKSTQRRFELTLEPYFTNSSGVIGVGGGIPLDKLPEAMQRQRQETHEWALAQPDDYKRVHGQEYVGEELEPLQLGSIAMSVYEDFGVTHLPEDKAPAPILIMFPEFRNLAHISTFEAVGHGLAWGVFKFGRCGP